MKISKQELIAKCEQFWVSKKNIYLVIRSALEITEEEFFLEEYFNLTEEKYWWIVDDLKRINFWYPIEYVVNSAQFYWYDFYVDSWCLIPRDDTELMVDLILERFKGYSWWESVYIDVWTWSWAIALSILLQNQEQGIENPQSTILIEISDVALAVAERNIINYKLCSEVVLRKWDLLCDYIDHTDDSLDRTDTLFITANLPYIKWNDTKNMDEEVYTYEPEIALYWWNNTGFELYEKLIMQLQTIITKYWIKDILFFIEIGFDQEEYATSFFTKKNIEYCLHKDTHWIVRCVSWHIKK